MNNRTKKCGIFFIVCFGFTAFVCGESQNGIETYELSNGIKLIHKYSRGSDVSALRIFSKHGSADEADSLAGISVLMQNLLLKGTKRKNQKVLSEAIDDLGARISFGAEYDYLDGSLVCSKERFAQCAALFAEIIKQPRFDPINIAVEKKSQINAVSSRKDSIFNVAYDQLNSIVFQGHPYSRLTLGTEESIENITRQDLIKLHASVYQPSRLIIVLAGDVEPSRAKEIAERHFGKLKKHDAPDVRERQIFYEPFENSISTNVASSFNQGYLMAGFLAPGVSDADYPAIKLLNSILGGGMSSRLFSTLREENYLAYEVSSFYPTRREISSFVVYIGLDPKNAGFAQAKIADEIKKLQSEYVPDQEIEDNKRYLRGTYLMSRQTNSASAWHLGWWEVLGMGHEYDMKYIDEIDAVERRDIKEAAEKYFSNKKHTVKVLPK